jgi:hypothetical protein
LWREKIEGAVDRLIKSNHDLADATAKHTKALVFVTGMLVVVGFLQLFAATCGSQGAVAPPTSSTDITHALPGS